jgi:hypothetical protein
VEIHVIPRQLAKGVKGQEVRDELMRLLQ